MKLNQVKKNNYCGLINGDSLNSFIYVHHSGGRNSPLSEEQAEELLDKCQKYVENNCERDTFSIDKYPSRVIVCKDGAAVIGFYVDEKDTWKYGITTMEKAEELAREFIRLYKMFMKGTFLMTPEPIKIVEGFGSTRLPITLYKGTDKIAIIYNRKEAYDFASQLAPIHIDEEGLISYGHGWYRSILCSQDIPEEVLSELSSYIFKNW